MTKTVQSGVAPFNFHYPSGATIVTSHADGKDNAMAVAWHTAISREPPYYAVSISPKRFSHALIVESGEFTVNFVPWEERELVARVAGCSGRDVDKFVAFQIAAQKGSEVKAPVLEVAFAAYECRLVGRHAYGDHDIFVAEVVAVQWDPSAFTDDVRLDLESVSPVSYMGDDHYVTAAGDVYVDRNALVQASLETARQRS